MNKINKYINIFKFVGLFYWLLFIHVGSNKENTGPIRTKVADSISNGIFISFYIENNQGAHSNKI